MRSTVLFTLLLASLLVVGAVGLAAADDGGKGKPDGRGGLDGRGGDFERHGGFGHDGNKWVLHNDVLAVWFHGGKNAKPDLRVVLNGTSDDKSGYRVQILRLCEVASDSTDCTRDLPRLNLAAADDWNVMTNETNTTLTLTMTHAAFQGIVGLVFHVDTTTAVVKFDVNVQNWRWANASDRLVLDTNIIGRNLHNSTGANVSLDDSGYITWAPTATATYGPNDTRTLNVTAVQKGGDRNDTESDVRESDESQHEMDERANGHGGHLLLVFDGPGNYSAMSYDPTFGIASTSTSKVPAPTLVIVLGVVGVSALLLRRRN